MKININFIILLIKKSNDIFNISNIRNICNSLVCKNVNEKINESKKINENKKIPQFIITKKNKKKFYLDENNNELYLNENKYIENKKLISISPGGFNGFYIMGTCCYIKENYNLKNYIFSGASAGAWNSLFMTFRKNPKEFIKKILDEKVQNQKNIENTEKEIKKILLESYTKNDFDLHNLFIGVTHIKNPKTSIYSDFENLEDAINCCIASSHIPYITGPIRNNYNNISTFDGGFSKYPYLNVKKSVFHITPDIWKKEKASKKYKFFDSIKDYTTLFSKSKYIYKDLYDDGYNDAKTNKELLDEIFSK